MTDYIEDYKEAGKSGEALVSSVRDSVSTAGHTAGFIDNQRLRSEQPYCFTVSGIIFRSNISGKYF